MRTSPGINMLMIAATMALVMVKMKMRMMMMMMMMMMITMMSMTSMPCRCAARKVRLYWSPALSSLVPELSAIVSASVIGRYRSGGPHRRSCRIAVLVVLVPALEGCGVCVCVCGWGGSRATKCSLVRTHVNLLSGAASNRLL